MTSTAAVRPARPKLAREMGIARFASETETVEARRSTSRYEMRRIKAWNDAIMRRPYLRDVTRRLAYFLADLFRADARGDQKGFIHPSTRYLEELTGLSRNSITAAVRELTGASGEGKPQFLTYRKGGGRGRASEYAIRFPAEDTPS